MALQLLQLPTPSSSSSSSSSTSLSGVEILRSRPFLFHCYKPKPNTSISTLQIRSRHRGTTVVYAAANSKEESVSVADEQNEEEKQLIDDPSVSPQDLEYVAQIQRVLKLLKKNRNMLYNEVKLTIMIEDPREVERRRLLGIEDPDSPTRDDLVAALDDVKEGRIPENRFALQILAEEMVNWPNLEVEIEKKKPRKSLYAKATDTGVDPKVAAKRLNIDWDTAAEIEDTGQSEQTDLPSAVGFGALYLVSAFPIIIGVSVVLILFYNSLQ